MISKVKENCRVTIKRTDLFRKLCRIVSIYSEVAMVRWCGGVVICGAVLTKYGSLMTLAGKPI